MHKLYELKEKLISELEDYADNGKFSKEDVETIKYTASAVDHICNIMEGMDDGYSETGGGYYGVHNTGNSYARRTGRNSYMRGGMRSNRRGANQYGPYSMASEGIAEQLRDMVPDAPNDKIRMEIEKLADKVEQM